MKLVQEEKKPTRWEGWQEGWVWGSWIAHSALLSQSVPSELLQGQIKKDLRLPWLNSLEWTSVSACSHHFPLWVTEAWFCFGERFPTHSLWPCGTVDHGVPLPLDSGEGCDQQSQSLALFQDLEYWAELSEGQQNQTPDDLSWRLGPGHWRNCLLAFAVTFRKLPSFTRSGC